MSGTNSVWFLVALNIQHGLDRQTQPLLQQQPLLNTLHNIPITSTSDGSDGDEILQQGPHSVFTKVSLDPDVQAISGTTQETSRTATGWLSGFNTSALPLKWFETYKLDLLSSYVEGFKWMDLETKSISWIHKSVCSWLSICDGINIELAESSSSFQYHKDTLDWQIASATGPEAHDSMRSDIPHYILQHAPLVHLYSGEQFWPCDIAEHLDHTTPTLNYTAVEPQLRNSTLPDLDLLNRWQHGRFVFLTSNDDVEERPEWLEGAKNIPSSEMTSRDSVEHGQLIHRPGQSYLQELSDVADDLKNRYENPGRLRGPAKQATRRDEGVRLEELREHLKKFDKPSSRLRGGRSEAPAILIAVDKGHGIVDAFWFFFYSFNLGNKVFNIRFGNHVGDWEHCAIRFHHGQPKAVFFSEHNFGSAYSYAAVEKLGKRPIIYSAVGTHAMYATPGTHPYVLPLGILHDQTDKGPLWDPTLNSHTYTYDFKNDVLRASNMTPEAPVGWFHFSGHWGDKTYPLNDKRQYRLAGQYHYVNGPLGPKFKNLGRRKICGGPDAKPCVIKHWLNAPGSAIRWKSHGENADAFSAYIEDERSRFV